MGWIPSSCSGEVLPLFLGISLKAMQEQREAPGTDPPPPAGAVGQPGGGRNVCGFPALPKTAPAGTGSHAGGHGDPPLPLEPDPHSLQGKSAFGEEWTQSLDVRNGPGKGWEMCESSGSLLSSLPLPAPLTAFQGELCPCLCHGSSGSWEQPALRTLREIIFIFKNS